MAMLFAETNNVLQKFADDVTRLARIGLGARRDIIGRRTKWKGNQVISSQKVRRKGIINASGNLSKSLENKIEKRKGAIVTKFLMNSYGIYIDQGRKPGNVKRGALDNWPKQKGMRPRKMEDGKLGGFAKNTESSRKAMLFMIGRKIKHFGYEKTEFFTEPFSKEYKTLTDEVQAALVKDFEINFTYDNKRTGK